MAIDPIHSSTVYAATTTGEVLKTLDGGMTWALLPPIPPPTAIAQSNPIWRLTVDPSSPDTVYALSALDVLQSRDGGFSWTARTAGLPSLPDYNLLSMAIDPSRTSRLYVGSRTGLYVSNDYGQQWTLVREGYVYRIAVDPNDSAILYLAFGNGSGSFLSSTRDGGKTWNDRAVGSVVQIAIDSISSAYALTHPSGAVAEGGILTTTDHGQTWTSLPASLPNATVLAIEPTAARAFYASNGVGLFKSENGGTTWRQLHKGLNAPYMFDVASAPAEPLTVYAATQKGVVKSTDAGSNWSDAQPSIFGARLAMDDREPSTLFAFSEAASARSTDGGDTWTAVNPGDYVRGIAIDPSNSANVYAILTNGLSRSTDGGSSWTSITNVQLPLGYYGFDGGAIAVDPVIPTNVYAAGDGGIIKSTDAGMTWKTIFQDSGTFQSFGFRRLLIDPRRSSSVYALAWDKVYASGNAGQSWSIIYSTPSKEVVLWDLDLDPLEPSRLYLTTSAGLLRSVNRGVQWTEFNEGLPTRSIASVTVDSAGNVYAATRRGLFVNSPVPRPSTISVSFRTSAGNYVSANGCGGSFVHANAHDAGPCETFTLFDINAGELKDGDAIHLQAANGGYVVAEGGGSMNGSASPVNANRGVPAAWETFVIHRKGGSGRIRSGDSIALQSVNGGYVAAEGGGTSGCQCDSRLNANRSEAREWETFLLITG